MSNTNHVRSGLLSFLLLAFFFAIAHFAVGQNFFVSISSSGNCNGTLTASVTGGVPPYNYDWSYMGTSLSGPSNTFTGYNGGYASLHVTDANQDTASTDHQDVFPFTFSTSTSAAICPQSNGSATVGNISGGTAPFTFLWSNGATTQGITGLAAGTYEVTVTDANGCFMTSSWPGVIVSEGSPISLSFATVNSWCNNGSTTVTATGGVPPYNYVWNTIPAQTTASISSLSPGNYSVTVTDANGCIKTGSTSVQNTSGPFNITLTATSETCLAGNGTITTTASGGTQPYTYLWNNGATTPNLTNLSYGSYRLTLTDAVGCEQIRSVTVNRSNGNLQAITNHVMPTCGNQNGSISLTASGGTPPYIYTMNGTNTQSLTGLGFGNYFCKVEDANGCMAQRVVNMTLPPACLNSVEGTVYDDLNNNCIRDWGEPAHPNVVVQIGNGFVTTGWGGYFSLSDYFTGPVNVTVFPSANHSNSCGNGTQTLNFSGYGGNQYAGDFANVVSNSYEDLEVTMQYGPARPGFSQWVNVRVKNVGTVDHLVSLEMMHEPSFTYSHSFPAATNYISNTHTLSWNGYNIQHGTSVLFRVTLNVPTTATIGSFFNHSASVLPVANDVTPSNNVVAYQGIVTGSYDPNAKMVYQPESLSPSDSVLQYTVFFQNTGTDTAFTVEVLDTLDTDLEMSSIDMIEASHLGYVWSIVNGNVLKVTFNNIYLPDSIINEPASHGHFSYSIRIKENLPLPIFIDNQAAIYFDYNLPIFTNTTHNELILESVDESFVTTGMTLAPNPTEGEFAVIIEAKQSQDGTLKVTDLAGRTIYVAELQAVLGENKHSLDLRTQPAGMYFVTFETEGQMTTKKLIKK